MADILIDNQAAPSTPAASKSVIWVDSTTKKLLTTDDGGIRHGLLSKNAATASTTVNAADTYLTGSSILIPSYGMEAGQVYRWWITATKTAAGTAAAIFTFRIGAAQSTGDTSRLALTATTAQTAAVSSGVLSAFVSVRNVGASGVLAGGVGVQSNNAGLGSGISGVSSTFDNTAVAGQYLGLSINSGSLGVWTVEAVYAELVS
jgi:hypothetical protein